MTDNNTQLTGPGANQPAFNRRRLLKVAVATAPVIATLPTGAALARTSNLIGATSGTGTDSLGRTLCLDLESGRYRDGLLDLGPHGDGELTAITERDYRLAPLDTATAVTEKKMCNDGGTYYYYDSATSTWQSTPNIPPGIVVSATALSSFAGSIFIREI